MKKNNRLVLTIEPEFADKIRDFLHKSKKEHGVSIQRTVTNILLVAIDQSKKF